MLTGARRINHITPVLWKLRCIRVLFCAQFKALMMAYKVVHRKQFGYMKEFSSTIFLHGYENHLGTVFSKAHHIAGAGPVATTRQRAYSPLWQLSFGIYSQFAHLIPSLLGTFKRYMMMMEPYRWPFNITPRFNFIFLSVFQLMPDMISWAYYCFQFLL